MLGRYKIYRGKRAPDDPMPKGLRQDTRFRTKHPLRPTAELVEAFLESVDDDAAWQRFSDAYLALLAERFAADRAPFDALAAAAMNGDVHLGCSCPTQKNPRVEHCHTYLALRFMKRKYAKLKVVLPG